jgi:hypothetical protein
MIGDEIADEAKHRPLIPLDQRAKRLCVAGAHLPHQLQVVSIAQDRISGCLVTGVSGCDEPAFSGQVPESG